MGIDRGRLRSLTAKKSSQVSRARVFISYAKKDLIDVMGTRTAGA
jgi:hypothetical protein